MGVQAYFVCVIQFSAPKVELGASVTMYTYNPGIGEPETGNQKHKSQEVTAGYGGARL